jgi:four helix bundle protein
MSERISSFRELRVYKHAFALQQTVFDVSRSFPREEQYSLTDQFRRASRSIGANIAEAWQKRRYSAHFVSKLTDADAEQAETQHWIETASACGYLNQRTRTHLMEQCSHIGSMLGAMIAAPEKFCR